MTNQSGALGAQCPSAVCHSYRKEKKVLQWILTTDNTKKPNVWMPCDDSSLKTLAGIVQTNKRLSALLIEQYLTLSTKWLIIIWCHGRLPFLWASKSSLCILFKAVAIKYPIKLEIYWFNYNNL